MKRVILALTVAFATVTTNMYAQDYAFGIKAGVVNSNLTNFTEGRTGVNDEFLNIGIIPSLYGEYAFHDMVGAELEVGYFVWGKVDSETDKNNKDKTYKNLNVQFLKASLGVKVYPLGREDKEEMGILSTRVGVDGYLPFSAKWNGQNNGTKNDMEVKKDDLTSFGIGIGGGVGYEFPFGLVAEINGGYAFTPFFKEDAAFKITELKIKKETSNNLWNFGLAVGYNFAPLFEA